MSVFFLVSCIRLHFSGRLLMCISVFSMTFSYYLANWRLCRHKKMVPPFRTPSHICYCESLFYDALFKYLVSLLDVIIIFKIGNGCNLREKNSEKRFYALNKKERKNKARRRTQKIKKKHTKMLHISISILCICKLSPTFSR